jgi:hypothetical protein
VARRVLNPYRPEEGDSKESCSRSVEIIDGRLREETLETRSRNGAPTLDRVGSDAHAVLYRTHSFTMWLTLSCRAAPSNFTTAALSVIRIDYLYVIENAKKRSKPGPEAALHNLANFIPRCVGRNVGSQPKQLYFHP